MVLILSLLRFQDHRQFLKQVLVGSELEHLAPNAQLEVDGISSNWAARVRSPNVASNSFGLLTVAGTNGSDYSLLAMSASAASLFAVYGNGNAWFAGTVTASCGVLSCSDIRYKKDITPLANVMQNINKISGVDYYWKKDEFPGKSFSNKKQIGIIARN